MEWPVAQRLSPAQHPWDSLPSSILTAIALLHGSKTLRAQLPWSTGCLGPTRPCPLSHPLLLRSALSPPTNSGRFLAHLWAPSEGQARKLCVQQAMGTGLVGEGCHLFQTPICLDVEAPRTSVGSSSHKLIKYNHLLFLSCKILQGLT